MSETNGSPSTGQNGREMGISWRQHDGHSPSGVKTASLQARQTGGNARSSVRAPAEARTARNRSAQGPPRCLIAPTMMRSLHGTDSCAIWSGP